jgi:hypothetical protein
MTEMPEDLTTQHKRWEQAACGRHCNRYCEQDDVWESSCVYCCDNYQKLKERDERIARVEAENADLKRQLEKALERTRRSIRRWRQRPSGSSQAGSGGVS